MTEQQKMRVWAGKGRASNQRAPGKNAYNTGRAC
jgi:hypothetical protein